MKLNCLFIHDHVFGFYRNKAYSEGKITDSTFKRYVSSDSSGIIVLSRKRELLNESDRAALVGIESENLRFCPVKGRSFFHVFSKHLVGNFLLAFKCIRVTDFLVVRLPSFLGVFALLVNVFFRKKYFIEVVGDPAEALLGSNSHNGFFYSAFVSGFTKLNAFFILRASGVIYVTKSHLQRKYPSLGFVSYASNVDISVEQLSLSFSRYQQKNNDCFSIGLIGSFNNEYKGIGNAISALEILRGKGVPATLRILGSGKLMSFYLQQANKLGVHEYVFFDGVLTGQDKINNWLDNLDLYIQPSLSEGLPRALIEAMARGLPAVASDVGGIGELLHENHLIPTNDVLTLASVISSFYSSASDRFAAGCVNYTRALEYDRERVEAAREVFWTKARSLVNEQKQAKVKL